MLRIVKHAFSNWGAIALTAAALLGCQPAGEIETYTVERTRAPREPFEPAAYAESLDQVLVAIVRRPDKAWFFKLSGPTPAILRQRAAVIDFLETVQASDGVDNPISWELPAGWEEKPASELRLATLVIPDEQGPLELAVSTLPAADNWEDFLTRNVNRWLGQLNRAPLSTDVVIGLAEQVHTRAGPATLFELSGRLTGAPRPNPPAGGNMTPPPRPASLTYDTPAGWQPGRVNSFRKAAFNIVDGDARAEVTVLDFPAAEGTQMADVAANVQRWAGQVGLSPLDAAALEELTEPITIDGIEGAYIRLLGPAEAERPRAILGAMLTRGDKVWFLKMAGDRALVEREQATFREFLASVQFVSP